MRSGKDLIIILLLTFFLISALEWGAKTYLINQYENSHHPRAKALGTGEQNPVYSQNIDPLLGWATPKVDNKNFEYEDYKVLKNTNSQAKKIMILGGSTSDITYDPHAWPQLLFNQIDKEGHEVIVYLGAVLGYNSHQELLKLVRDIRLIKPDVIISYTGANEGVDTENPHPFYPYHTQTFYYKAMAPLNFLPGLSTLIAQWVNPTSLTFGPKDHLSYIQRFESNLQMMNALTKEYGADFFAIAQPYLTSGQRKINEAEKRALKDPYIKTLINFNDKFYEKVLENSSKKDFVIDGREFLDSLDHAFFDDCHVTPEANEIIAGKISKLLKSKNIINP